MRIAITETAGKTITLRIPTRIILNHFTAMLAPRFIQQSGLSITRNQALVFIKAIHYARSRYRGWKLLEMESRDGERIEITL